MASLFKKILNRLSRKQKVMPATAEPQSEEKTFPTLKRSVHTAQSMPSKLIRWIPTVVPALIGIALADLLSDGMYFFLQDIPSKIKVSVPKQAPPAAAVLKKSLVTDLVTNNILDHTNTVPGQIVKKEGVSELTLDKAIKSSLPHKLLGTIVFSDPRRSLATLEVGKDTLTYLSGEEVKAGYKVWGVERGKVYLHNVSKNTLEYIEVEIEGGASLIGPAVSVAKPLTESPKEIQQVSENKFSVERSFIKEKLTNLQDLLTQAQAVPTGDGWKIVSIAEGSIFEYIGLQPGDVITGVNGKEVKTQADAIMLFNQFQSGTQATIQLELKREGQNMTLNYDLK